MPRNIQGRNKQRRVDTPRVDRFDRGLPEPYNPDINSDINKDINSDISNLRKSIGNMMYLDEIDEIDEIEDNTTESSDLSVTDRSYEIMKKKEKLLGVMRSFTKHQEGLQLQSKQQQELIKKRPPDLEEEEEIKVPILKIPTSRRFQKPIIQAKKETIKKPVKRTVRPTPNVRPKKVDT